MCVVLTIWSIIGAILSIVIGCVVGFFPLNQSKIPYEKAIFVYIFGVCLAALLLYIPIMVCPVIAVLSACVGLCRYGALFVSKTFSYIIYSYLSIMTKVCKL